MQLNYQFSNQIGPRRLGVHASPTERRGFLRVLADCGERHFCHQLAGFIFRLRTLSPVLPTQGLAVIASRRKSSTEIFH